MEAFPGARAAERGCCGSRALMLTYNDVYQLAGVAFFASAAMAL
jgi:hypothetical protein